ncbi:transposase [Rhizophagus clarus]|uniref:Transposase n=1 Tax=Rhizophagus clarus TaxID=94130 RepID=A0A8H3QFI9_9GLOM|nr:transposase [Rhizophagus clarus]
MVFFNKRCDKIGKYDIKHIFYSYKHIDDLISKKDKLASSTSKQKKKKTLYIDNAISHMQKNIKHLQNKIYQKIINFLTDEFNVVIIPSFEVSNIVNRKTQKITRKTVKKMLCWSYYKFQQYLISKTEEKGIILTMFDLKQKKKESM